MARAYSVLCSFEATQAISGRKRRIEPPAVVKCDLSESGSMVTIELDMSLYLVAFLTFNTCCREMQGRDVGAIADALDL